MRVNLEPGYDEKELHTYLAKVDVASSNLVSRLSVKLKEAPCRVAAGFFFVRVCVQTVWEVMR